MSRPGRRSHSRSRSRSPDSLRGRRREDKPWSKRSRSQSRSRSRSRSPHNRGRRSRSPFKRPVMSKDPKFLNSRVFVANLASDKTSDAELKDLFLEFGKVIDTLVHHNGYGFVQFSSEEEGRQAVDAVNGMMFHGKKLKCNMAAEGGKRGGGGGGGGGGGMGMMGRGGGGPPPPGENRYGREHSPGQDPYGPPFENPYMRGREIPPPPRDLPPLPPPRDPFFDDPYRRPLPPDPFFDRIRDDPFRDDPYGPPYGDRFREVYSRSVLDAAVAPPAPKKPMTVDCEIVIMSADLRPYGDMVERRLKNINLLTNVVVIREDFSIPQHVEDAVRRSCLFAIIINNQNEIHRSLTLNILHGVAQEHRNMPLDDALSLVARSFEQYLQAEKEKLSRVTTAETMSVSAVDLHITPKDMAYLFNLLADSRPVTLEEMDKVMGYLQEKREKMMAASGLPPSAGAATQPPLSQYPPQQLQHQQLQQQLQLQQQQQQQQQQQKQHKELESKILSMMNGTAASAAAAKPGLLHGAVLPTAGTSYQQASSMLGVSTLTSQAAVTSPLAVSAVKPPAAPSATLINFDNPTVQKALDNLIQSGPSLLKNISQPSLYPSTSSATQRKF